MPLGVGSCHAIEGKAWVKRPCSHSGHDRAAGPVPGSTLARCNCPQHATRDQLPARHGVRGYRRWAHSHVTSAATARVDAPAQHDSHPPPTANGDGDTIAAIVTGDPQTRSPSSSRRCQLAGPAADMLCRAAGGCVHRALVWPGRNNYSAAPVQAQRQAKGRLGPRIAQGVPWPPHRCQRPQH